MRGVFIIIFMALVLPACKSKKHLGKTSRRNVDSLVFVHSENGKDSLLRQKWQYFSGRMAVDYYSKDEEQSFNLALRMRKDSIIWFSVSAVAGIQVMKGVITNDSIRALDLFNKRYYAYGISTLGKKFGADIGLRELQNIFLGNPIFDTLVYRKDPESAGWLGINQPVANIIFCKDFKLPDSTLLAQKGSDRQLMAKYSNTLSAGSLTIAQFIDLLAGSASNSVRMQIEFKTASDAFITSYPFNVPPGYDKISEE